MWWLVSTSRYSSSASLTSSEPHQRRGRHVEPRRPGRPPRSARIGGLAVLGARAGEVDLAPRQLDVVPDDLDGAPPWSCDERRPQVRVPVEQGLTGPADPVRVDGAPQRQGQLHQVRVDRRVRELGVEEQAGLQRRQRPHVGQAGEPGLEPLDRVLSRSTRARSDGVSPARGGRVGVPGQRGRRLHPQLRELAHLEGPQDPASGTPTWPAAGPVRGAEVIALMSRTAATGICGSGRRRGRCR